jgi:hypothetical protein
MAFRSHLLRPFDLTLRSTRILFVMVGITALAALYRWMTVGEIEVLSAPAHVFLGWALVRELDPDHQWSALATGAAAGLWVLIGYPAVTILAVAGLLLAARLVVNSTGRRPLLGDMLVVDVLASVISYTAVGWVAGFGLAIALYVDDRMAEESNPRAVLAAGAAALGATVVATAARAFPSQVPDVRPLPVTVIGVIGLACVLRAPPIPMSLVDSRIKTPILQGRVHAAWSLIGVLAFVAAVLAGEAAEELYPVAGALVAVLVASEVESARRRK